MILFIDQSGQVGGAELCLADLAAGHPDAQVLLFSDGPFVGHLRSRHIPVEVLALPDASARITKGASAAKLAATIPGLFSHVLALSHRVRRADLIYLNTAKALIFGVAANLMPNKPSIFHLHDLLDPAHFSPANIRLLVGSANRATAVIANSQATAEAFLAAGGTTSTHIIPNGFDPDVFGKAPAGKVAALRQELNPGHGPVVAIFGRLTRWKGQHILLQAAPLLPAATFWLIGEALFTDDDRIYADELRTQAESLGARVRMLGFREDIPDLMQAADIVAHCSTAPEPFGRVLVEAMLSGKPVVATAAGGPREIVEDGVTGFLTPPGDARALAAALKDLTDSVALRDQMGAAGRERAIRLFSLSLIREKTDALLQSLLSP